MSKYTAYLSLGSNLGDRQANLDAAVAALRRLPRTCVEAVSDYLCTAPVDYTDQPDFLNAAVRLSTGLSPRALLGCCLGIEATMGRVREIPGGPRLIDLDLLLYEGITETDHELTLPHPRMHERDFVKDTLKQVI